MVLRSTGVLGRLVSLVVVAWLPIGAALSSSSQDPLTLVHANWSSSVASANVIKAVLEQHLGRPCRLREVAADEMWRSVAAGEADATASAWLPHTHADYREAYGPQIDDLGPNLEGARIGLVVPAAAVGRQTGGRGRRPRPYMTVDAIPELAEEQGRFGGRIVGIEPQAGVVQRAREAMRAYNLEGFRLVEGSEEGMTRLLSRAIRHQEWIVVTGWRPHWMWGQWHLRFLEDPRGIFGGEERIHTLARAGLREAMPRAYRLLDRFHWSPEEMGQLLLWNEQDGGIDPYGNAERWVRTHPEQVKGWLD